MTLSTNQKHEIYIQMTLAYVLVASWVTQDLIQILCDYNSRQMAHRLLQSMEKQGLIRRHNIHLDDGRRKSVVSLTPHGMGMALKDGDNPADFKPFSIAKFQPATYAHEVMLREVQIHADTLGWNDWHYENTMKVKGSKKPDALVTDTSGSLMCIECERSFKSLPRYKQIVYQHLIKMNAGDYQKVLYIAPDDQFNKRLKQILMGIEAINHRGRKIALTDAHKKPFFFKTIQEIRELAVNASFDKQGNSAHINTLNNE